MNKELDEETLQDLYAWIDKIPLSRPKRNIARDFSDGVMAAEVVKFYFPKLVELHNYTPANSTQQKLSNWDTLNRKVFPKLNFHVPEDSVKKISLCTAGLIESVLCTLRERLEDKRLGRTLDERGTQDLEYYSTINEKSKTDYLRVPAAPAQTKPGPGPKKEESKVLQKSRPQPNAVTGSHVDPTFRVLMEEKEQALLALQETVEILQIKVNRLEHLVQLKDLRIEDLTRHLALTHEHSVSVARESADLRNVEIERDWPPERLCTQIQPAGYHAYKCITTVLWSKPYELNHLFDRAMIDRKRAQEKIPVAWRLLISLKVKLCVEPTLVFA
ncbi:hypothetical protein SKAU_G00181610 [Synaphobranchus kaupii]|uniref:Calponin-homology (CH) domain-containing protein n=1 Tax=Synaphobranchus kaupii TaxID=118154 RepID=A0A9Q1J0T3_SYNKA|nr:hypothetical protein SKAU_G00181610 [Synaphobranchus kaupii]